MALLIVLNGPPGVGKSTLARRYVSEHPMALSVGIDSVRRMLGRWRDEPATSTLIARELTLVMAGAHLRAGRDVVLPQYLGNPRFLAEAEDVARNSGAHFAEFVLMDDRDTVVQRFADRSAAAARAEDVEAGDLVTLLGGQETLFAMYDRLLLLLSNRPGARVLQCPDGAQDTVYAQILDTLNVAMTYVEVAGHQVWHEMSGAGEPVLLLHGAFAGASSFGAQVPAFVDAGFSVFVPERRGHAHTPDIAGPLSYAVMAQDMIAYLDTVVTTPAHLLGWSDGAVVALLVALQRPDLVRRMVLIGQYYNSSGRIEGSELDALLASPEAMAYLRTEYDQVSPDGPEHFELVHAKTLTMIATEPEIDLGTLSSVTAQTLVLQGDRDEVSVQHSAAVVEALPDARLAVLPGTHALPIEAAELVNSVVIQFLRHGPPPPLWGALN